MRSMLIDVGLLVLRIGIGLAMLIPHGLPKLQGFNTMKDQFPDPIGVGSTTSLMLAIAAEVGCSVFLITGMTTRVVLIPLIVTMLVAFFSVHGEHTWDVKEKAALFLLVYTTLLITGPGRLALDTFVWGRKKKAN